MKFKKFSKFLSLLLLLTIFTSSTALASTENYNVSTTKPTEYNSGDIVPYGTSKPSTNWDLSTQYEYDFSGTAETSTLYTSVKFTNSLSAGFTITVKNKSTTPLTVKLIKDGLIDTTVKTYTVAANSTGIYTLSSETVSASSYYFLSFSAPSYFSGSIY